MYINEESFNTPFINKAMTILSCLSLCIVYFLYQSVCYDSKVNQRLTLQTTDFKSSYCVVPKSFLTEYGVLNLKAITNSSSSSTLIYNIENDYSDSKVFEAQVNRLLKYIVMNRTQPLKGKNVIDRDLRLIFRAQTSQGEKSIAYKITYDNLAYYNEQNCKDARITKHLTIDTECILD